MRPLSMFPKMFQGTTAGAGAIQCAFELNQPATCPLRLQCSKSLSGGLDHLLVALEFVEGVADFGAAFDGIAGDLQWKIKQAGNFVGHIEQRQTASFGGAETAN